MPQVQPHIVALNLDVKGRVAIEEDGLETEFIGVEIAGRIDIRDK